MKRIFGAFFFIVLIGIASVWFSTSIKSEIHTGQTKEETRLSVDVNKRGEIKGVDKRMDQTKENADTHSEEVDTLTRKALTEMKDENYDEAVKLWEKVIELDPKHADAHAWLAACYGSLIENADVLNKMKLNSKMKKELETAFLLSPDSKVAYKISGIRYLSAPVAFGGNIEKAIENLTLSIKYGMDDADTYYHLGLAYLKNKKAKEAKAAFEKSLEKDKNHKGSKENLEKLQEKSP